MQTISETDLIINADGSIYHLNLLPADVADTVITVGDPDRVGEVSKYFDTIELRKGKREFITHTGHLGGKRITVLSTGIGTDNIDIVLNELDALVNVDFETRTVKPELKKLNIIRIGTSGAIQQDIAVDSLLASSAAIGLDALGAFYRQTNTESQQTLLAEFTALYPGTAINPYMALADDVLLDTLAKDVAQGITITAPGFYTPQGRQVRAEASFPGLMDGITNFRSGDARITNLEMETAGIYLLAAALGHRAISFNVILANRAVKQFSKQPQEITDHYIKEILGKIKAFL